MHMLHWVRTAITTCALLTGSAAIAGDYTLVLVKVQSLEKVEASDEVFWSVNNKRIHGMPDGAGDYWRFGGSHAETRDIGYTVFADQDAGHAVEMSFHEQEGTVFSDRHIGTIKLEIDKNGDLVIGNIAGASDIGKDGKLYIVTLKRPDGKPGKYKLWFRRFRD